MAAGSLAQAAKPNSSKMTWVLKVERLVGVKGASVTTKRVSSGSIYACVCVCGDGGVGGKKDGI